MTNTADTNSGDLVLGSSSAVVASEDPSLDLVYGIVFTAGKFATLPAFLDTDFLISYYWRKN